MRNIKQTSGTTTDTTETSNLDKLHEAKKHSESKNYRIKGDILKKMMNDNPNDFTVDTNEKGHPGITHKPTGYKFHTPKRNIPPELLGKSASMLLYKLAKEKKKKKDDDDDKDDSGDVSLIKSLIAGGSAGLMSRYGASKLQEAYLPTFFRAVQERTPDIDQRGLARYIHEELRKNKSDITYNNGEPFALSRRILETIGTGDDADRVIKQMRENDHDWILNTGTHEFNGNPAAISHELGHIQGGEFLSGLNVAGKGITTAGAFMTGLLRDKKLAQIAALTGTAGGLGTIYSEMDASLRGAQTLRDFGASTGDSMRALAGIPSYLIAAAAPGAVYGLKNLFGGYEEDKDSEEDKEKEELEKESGFTMQDAKLLQGLATESKRALGGQPHWRDFKDSDYYKDTNKRLNSIDADDRDADPIDQTLALMDKDRRDDYLYEEYIRKYRPKRRNSLLSAII